METKFALNDETLETLQDLIRVNIDSYKGFDEAADTIENAPISTLFRELAQQRRANAAELRQYVKMNDEDAEDSGSITGAIHRWWLSARGALNGGDDYVVLIEAERGEDSIKERYEDVLKKTAGSAMNDVLQRQYRAVKAGHDKVRDLRDAHSKN